MTAIPPPPDYAPTAGLPVEWWRTAPASAASRLPDWREPLKPTTAELLAAASEPDEPVVEEQPTPDLHKPEAEAGVGEDDPAPGPDSEADEDLPVRWWQRKPLAWDPPAAPLAMRWRAPAPDLTRRRRHLLYNGAAAAVGWWSGLGPWCQHLIADFGHGSVRDGLTCGALCLLAALPIDLRTHAWRGAGHPLVRALGWVGRIPLATAVVAVALYGPDAVL